MLKVRGNHTTNHQQDICRKCHSHVETQEHVLEECPELIKEQENKITKTLIFSNDTEILKQTAMTIKERMEHLDQQGPPILPQRLTPRNTTSTTPNSPSPPQKVDPTCNCMLLTRVLTKNVTLHYSNRKPNNTINTRPYSY